MTLAIQGHPKRGSKVIEILEMLGGNNIYNLSGNSCNIYYIIEGFEREIRIRESIFDNENICLFTLEEFEEKFPYKIGDKVWLHYENLTIRISETITSMRWCSKDDCVLYDVCTCCNLKEYAFTPYKEETMKDKINISKLLKDCPKGMELHCTMYEDVYFDCVDELNIIHCYIQHETHKTSLTFNQHGTPNSDIKSKCVIFPKGKTTWEGFVPPCQFKDGDIVYVKSQKQNKFITIFKEIKNNYIHRYVSFGHQRLYSEKKRTLCHLLDVEIMRLATEEEKEKLFDAIKANGYKWNEETKTLEKLPKPKFKVGNRIKHKEDKTVITITGIKDDCYFVQFYNIRKNDYQNEKVSFKDQDKYELVSNKFNISTLKPFDKVLVRISHMAQWKADFFSHYVKDADFPYNTVGRSEWRYCIPYNSNEYLLGTTDDCDDYYKTWK